MSNSDAEAGLAAPLEALAAEEKRHADARTELAQAAAALEAVDPDDRKALDRAIAAHAAARARVEALAAREAKASAAVTAARAAIAAAERAAAEAMEDARRAEIGKAKHSAMAKLEEARAAVSAALARFAELGEPDEPFPGATDIRWSTDEAGRDGVTIRVRRPTPMRPALEPVTARDAYNAAQAAMGVATEPRPETLARERSAEIAQDARRYEIEAERLSR